MNYYIKERHNPQLGIYYVPYGQLTKKYAKESVNAIYGENRMLEFNTKEAYENKIDELRKAGKLA